MVRTFAACGLHQGDVIQNAYGYGLFTGGLGAHYGAEALGRDGHPHLRRQHRAAAHGDAGLRRHRHLLHAVATSSTWSSAPGTLGIDFARLRVGVFGAEPWTEAMRARIQEDTGIRAYDIYGLSEIIGPGRGRRVPAPGRAPPLRGPLLPGDHRPGDRRGAARTAPRASWSSPPSRSRRCR